MLVDLVIEHRGEAHGAQHSQSIFSKTLRFASSSGDEKCTALGCLPSMYASSERNVATSNWKPFSTTRITPKCAPTAYVREKSFCTTSGLASVAMSKSFGA